MSDSGPLSPEQKEQLATAAKERDKLLKPARLARMNGWTAGVFGALSVLFGLMSGGGGIVIGVALIAVAWNEMRGVKRLRALDPEGARILGWNQLVLAAVVVAYCGFTILHARTAPEGSMQALREAAGISSELVSSLTTVFYGAVAVLVAVVQALLARYHFRAGERVTAFRGAQPQWVLDVLGATELR